jgi:hypothetical protein
MKDPQIISNVSWIFLDFFFIFKGLFDYTHKYRQIKIKGKSLANAPLN